MITVLKIFKLDNIKLENNFSQNLTNSILPTISNQIQLQAQIMNPTQNYSIFLIILRYLYLFKFFNQIKFSQL